MHCGTLAFGLKVLPVDKTGYVPTKESKTGMTMINFLNTDQGRPRSD